MTGLPSILGGRVKTLHPTVFGGILARRDNENDGRQAEEFGIEMIDLVIVDLYPFAQTVASGASHQDIIEKIDIGGISLIRAAAKNFNDVTIVASKNQSQPLLDILETQGAKTTLEQRRAFARDAFAVSSRYDSEIFNYFDSTSGQEPTALRIAVDGTSHLRYAENPHQKGCFFGDLNEVMEQLHGKEISYNNLLDIDAAVALMDDLDSFGVSANTTTLVAWHSATPFFRHGKMLLKVTPCRLSVASSLPIARLMLQPLKKSTKFSSRQSSLPASPLKQWRS